jgi:type II secretory pathway component GspD/PulD (secretin)
MSGPQEMSSRQFLRLAEKALNQYGLVLVQQGGAVLVREAPAKTGVQQLKTGVTKVVALGNIAADPAAGIVADIVEGQSGVAVQSLPDANGVMLQGDEAAVAAASGLLAGIDQPQYAGARVARIAPMLWSSDALAEKLRHLVRRVVELAVGADFAGFRNDDGRFIWIGLSVNKGMHNG